MNRYDAVIAGLCGAWIAGFLVLTIERSPRLIAVLTGENAADWASASATLTAVIVALGIAVAESIRSQRAERRSRQERQHQGALRLRHLLIRLKSLVDVAQASIDESGWSEIEAELTRAAIADLLIKFEAIDPTDMPAGNGFAVAAAQASVGARAASAVCSFAAEHIRKEGGKYNGSLVMIAKQIDQIFEGFHQTLAEHSVDWGAR